MKHQCLQYPTQIINIEKDYIEKDYLINTSGFVFNILLFLLVYKFLCRVQKDAITAWVIWLCFMFCQYWDSFNNFEPLKCEIARFAY